MDYYEKVLGFTTLSANVREGKVGHAEMQFGDSTPLVFTSTSPGPGIVKAMLDKMATGALRGVGIMLLVDVGDADMNSYYEDIKSKGAKFVEPLEQKPWGTWMFRVEDPYGHIITFEKP